MKKLLSALALCLALPLGWASVPSVAAAGPLVVQDFSAINPADGKNIGTFQDSNGSKIALSVKGKGSKAYLLIDYTLVQGGYTGLWCRAGGADWSGVDLSKAKDLRLQVYSKKPVSLGLALKDKNNNQYVAVTPEIKAGSWQTVSVPMSSFKLDPYYTPPDAVKGAPEDFSKVTTFNIQAKDTGTFSVGVSKVTAQ